MKNLMSSFSFAVLIPLCCRGSTNKVVEWYSLLILETKAYIWEAGFKPIIGLLSKRPVSVTLVQCLIERWWDTTHTFHIAEWLMTVTPYDFYYMIGLSFGRAIIYLDGVLSIQLGFDKLSSCI